MPELQINLTTLLSEQHEAGRGIGYDEGYQHGYDDARNDLIARLDQLVKERSGSKYDAGAAALAQARERLAVTVDDITPPEIRG